MQGTQAQKQVLSGGAHVGNGGRSLGCCHSSFSMGPQGAGEKLSKAGPTLPHPALHLDQPLAWPPPSTSSRSAGAGARGGHC